MESTMLKLDEVAAKLRVSYHTIRMLISSGKLRAVRVGKSIRVDESDLEKFLGDSELSQK